jgi:hypothetical protein
MDEGALALTEQEVLERRERKKVVLCEHSARDHPIQSMRRMPDGRFAESTLTS